MCRSFTPMIRKLMSQAKRNGLGRSVMAVINQRHKHRNLHRRSLFLNTFLSDEEMNCENPLKF